MAQVNAALGGVHEACQSLLEIQVDGAGWAITVLCDDDFRLIGELGRFVVDLIAVEEHDDVGVLFKEHDDVGVLFKATTFSEVRKLRALVLPLFDRTRKLGGGEHWYIQFAGQFLHRAADVAASSG